MWILSTYHHLLFSFSLWCLWQSKSFQFWLNPIYQFFLIWIVLWCWILRNSLPNFSSWRCSKCYFFTKSFVLGFTFSSMIYFESLWIKCKMVNFYAYGWPEVPTFVKKTVLSPVRLCTFVKNQVAIFMWVHICPIY